MARTLWVPQAWPSPDVSSKLACWLEPEIWQQRAAQREQARQVSQRAQELRLKLEPAVPRAALRSLRQQVAQQERRQGASELLLRRHRVFLFQL